MGKLNILSLFALFALCFFSIGAKVLCDVDVPLKPRGRIIMASDCVEFTDKYYVLEGYLNALEGLKMSIQYAVNNHTMLRNVFGGTPAIIEQLDYIINNYHQLMAEIQDLIVLRERLK